MNSYATEIFKISPTLELVFYINFSKLRFLPLKTSSKTFTKVNTKNNKTLFLNSEIVFFYYTLVPLNHLINNNHKNLFYQLINDERERKYGRVQNFFIVLYERIKYLQNKFKKYFIELSTHVAVTIFCRIECLWSKKW